MDLKSSLIDPSLRIYPSEKLLEFIQTLKPDYEIPENFLKLIKSPTIKDKGTVKLKGISQAYLLNDTEVTNLEKIKAAIVKLEQTLETEANDAMDNEVDKEVDDLFVQALDEETEMKTREEEKTKVQKQSEEEIKEKREGSCLNMSDLDWLYAYLNNMRSTDKDTPYLHELMKGTEIEMPENSVIKRNPVLEARCVKLRAQQDTRDYRKMTKGVDNVRMRFPDDSIAFQLKQINRQLIAIGQFIISIFAGFLFGFRGVEWMVGNLDFGFRMLLGVMCALIIALAEIYFLAKKLNEELNVPETVQLGGPPKFVDEKTYNYNQKKITTEEKEHKD